MSGKLYQALPLHRVSS